MRGGVGNDYAAVADLHNTTDGYGEVNLITNGVRQAWGENYDNVLRGVGALAAEPNYETASSRPAPYLEPVTGREPDYAYAGSGPEYAVAAGSGKGPYDEVSGGSGPASGRRTSGDVIYETAGSSGSPENWKSTLRKKPGQKDASLIYEGTENYDNVRFADSASSGAGAAGGPDGYLAVGGLEDDDIDIDEDEDDSGYGFVSDVLRQVGVDPTADAEHRRQTVYERPGAGAAPVINFPGAPPKRSDATL